MASDQQISLGHDFADATLLARALTHASAVADSALAGQNNERLEFIGDRVLGLAVADLLYRRYPDEPEGALAKRLTGLVQQAALLDVARRQGFERHLRLSVAESKAGVRDAMLADAVEAVIGAIFLDAGYAAALAAIAACWAPLLAADITPPEDPKTALQEWVQARGLALPFYETVAQSGPAHAPVFTLRVTVAGLPPAEATAASKRAAEKDAARQMLASIESKDKSL